MNADLSIKLNKDRNFEIWTLCRDTDYMDKIIISKNYLNCMPLYKWQYAHEYLNKKGKVDLYFPCFLDEMNRRWTGVNDLIKLDFLKDYEQKRLITLFKRKRNKDVKESIKNGWDFIWMGCKHESFLKTVEEIKQAKSKKRKQ